MQEPEFDAILQRSNPVKTLTEEERLLVHKMLPRSRTKFRFLRPSMWAAVTVFAIGGGAVAASAAGVWSPWAENDAFAKLPLTLPSGTSCEYRFGELATASDEVKAVANETFADFSIDEDEIIKTAKRKGMTADPLDNDEAYLAAARWSAIFRFEDALEAQGIDEKYQFSGAGHCQ